MVGQWPTRCLQARTGRTERRNHMLRKSLHALVPQLGVRAEGLDVRKKSPLSKEEKCFFLTSTFIEPAVPLLALVTTCDLVDRSIFVFYFSQRDLTSSLKYLSLVPLAQSLKMVAVFLVMAVALSWVALRIA